jgi:MOSC domain-containing protein YiiM
MKKLLATTVLAVLCVACMAGCTSAKDDTADTIDTTGKSGLEAEMLENGTIQPGAHVKKYVNENGEKEISYENPDGSAGGGVELD